MFTIRETANGWEVVDAAGNVLATGSYEDAITFLSGLFAFANAPTDDTDDGLLPDEWFSPGPVAYKLALPGGRDFTNCEWSWRPLPIPLMLQTKNLPAHMESELAGFALEMELDDNGEPRVTRGRFYDSEAGRQARDILKGDRTFGVSVDPSENITVEEGCGQTEEDPIFGEFCVQPLAIFTAYEIAGMTMVPFPGFEQAQIKLGTANDNPADNPADNQGDNTGNDSSDDKSNDNVDDSKKLAQGVVNYDATGGTEGHQCADCSHFEATGSDGDSPACQIVQDPIVNGGVCDAFAADTDDSEQDDDTDDTSQPDDSGSNTDLPGMAAEWDDGWALAVTQEDRDKYGMDDGSFPITSCGSGPGSVKSAVNTSGNHKNHSDEEVRAHIYAGAKRLGCTDQVPDDWNSDGTLKDDNKKQSIAASMSTARFAPPRRYFEMPEPALGEVFDGELLGDDVLVPQYNIVRDSLNRFVRWGDTVLGHAVPFTIKDPDDNGYRAVYGHLTYWGQCHVGNPWGSGRCAAVAPSDNGYADFYGSGYVVCDDGSELSTGLLHVGCEHSDAMDVRGVRDAAAQAGLAFAKIRIMDGVYGPWYCGVLLPTVTDEQVETLRALVLSGEWVPELGAVIAVNDGGFPMQRRDRIAASNGSVFVVANKVIRSSVVGGKLQKLVGQPTARPCAECMKRARAARERPAMNAAAVEARLAALEALNDRLVIGMETLLGRTEHMNQAAANHLLQRLATTRDAETS